MHLTSQAALRDFNGVTSVVIVTGVTTPGGKIGSIKIGGIEIGRHAVKSTTGDSAKIIQKSEIRIMQLTGVMSSAERDQQGRLLHAKIIQKIIQTKKKKVMRKTKTSTAKRQNKEESKTAAMVRFGGDVSVQRFMSRSIATRDSPLRSCRVL